MVQTDKNTTNETRDQMWKRIRAENVGASEVAALFGEHPYGVTKFQLWHQKSGGVTAPNLDNNDHVMRGNYMEAGIAAWASAKWEWPLVKADVYVNHATVVGMGSTPDYFVAGTKTPVQIKMVRYPDFKDKFDAEGENLIDAPLGFILQVQQELECLNEDLGWLLVCVGGENLLRMPITRDKAITASMCEAVEAFWTSIKANTPPLPDYQADGAVIAQLRRKGGKEPVDMSEDASMVALCQEYLIAKDWADSWKKEKAGLGSQILERCNGVNTVKVGSVNIKISDIPAIPEKFIDITKEMVGSKILVGKGKVGYPRLNIKDTNKPETETTEE